VSTLTLHEICEELALVDDRMAKLETDRPAVGTPDLVAWTETYLPVRQRMFRLVKLLGAARRNHVGADRKHYRPIVDQVLETVRP
jgi:hypothetical protein